MDSSTHKSPATGNYLVSPLTSVLQESLFKLQLLKVICHDDTATLSMLLGKDDGDQQSIRDIATLMGEYLSILSNPDLEWSTDTIQQLDSVKQSINIQFHSIYIQCMTKMSKTSLSPLSINELIHLNQSDDLALSERLRWEVIADAFIQYLTLSTAKFETLADQHRISDTAETAQDAINKLIQKYKMKKHEFDDLDQILERDREYRDNIKKDMTFNITKLEHDIDALKSQYDAEEKALRDHEVNTKKEQTENHEKMVKELNVEIDKTTSKLTEIKAMNVDLELEIKKKVKRLDNEIEDIRCKYDSDMISISEETEKLETLHEAEKKRLSELQVKIRKLKEEREEHEKLLREQKAKEEELRQMCEAAATKIQKVWRGYSTRKTLKKNKEKKKDKGKKNKK